MYIHVQKFLQSLGISISFDSIFLYQRSGVAFAQTPAQSLTTYCRAILFEHLAHRTVPLV